MDMLTEQFKQRVASHNELPGAPKRTPEELEQLAKNYRELLDLGTVPYEQRSEAILKKLAELGK
jgi:hypothetical protein